MSLVKGISARISGKGCVDSQLGLKMFGRGIKIYFRLPLGHYSIPDERFHLKWLAEASNWKLFPIIFVYI